jgi:hypothetical protein
MKKQLATLLCFVALHAAPAHAVTLLSTVVTTPVTAQVTTPQQIGSGTSSITMAVQCQLTVGTGGSTADAWLQTSLDGQATWQDVVNCHFTTAARLVVALASSNVPAAPNAPVAASDGTLAANTSLNIFGGWWRVKYTTTGTYTGGTKLVVDAVTYSRLRAYP